MPQLTWEQALAAGIVILAGLVFVVVGRRKAAALKQTDNVEAKQRKNETEPTEPTEEQSAHDVLPPPPALCRCARKDGFHPRSIDCKVALVHSVFTHLALVAIR